jgi:hypothetical protein
VKEVLVDSMIITRKVIIGGLTQKTQRAPSFGVMVKHTQICF